MTILLIACKKYRGVISRLPRSDSESNGSKEGIFAIRLSHPDLPPRWNCVTQGEGDLRKICSSFGSSHIASPDHEGFNEASYTELRMFKHTRYNNRETSLFDRTWDELLSRSSPRLLDQYRLLSWVLELSRKQLLPVHMTPEVQS